MFNFHVHAGTMEGETPPEVAVRAREAGYKGVGLLIRCTAASLSSLSSFFTQACREASIYSGCETIPGVELVHVPPPLIADCVSEARSLGMPLVAVHGEYPGGSVPEGTTLAAIQAGVDIVLHPGAVTMEEASLAASSGVYLELSLSPVYGFFNGHVAHIARLAGAPLVSGGGVRPWASFSSLLHRRAILRGAGLDDTEANAVDGWCLRLMGKLLSTSR